MGATRRGVLKRLAAGAAASIAGGRMVAAQSAAAEIGQGERAAMADFANAFLNDQGVPGLAVAIARNGKFVYAQGFGVADQNTGESVTPSNLFRIASVSKPFTSVAIFLLIEQGRLKLDDTVFGVHGLLQRDFGTPPYRQYVEQVTVEHLLTHTAGGWPKGAGDPMFSNLQMNHQRLISWTLDNVPLVNPPGLNFDYSNFGFCILGRVIEKLSGRDYAAFVRDAVLQRCGITDMRIAGNTLADRARGEVVYYGQNGSNPYGMNVARMDSHGGWLASVFDLVNFATAADAMLKPETVAIMTKPTPANPHYAKGWAMTGRNQWHNGSLPGTSSIMVRLPNGFCWAALANSRRTDTDTVQAIDRLVWNMARSVKIWAL